MAGHAAISALRPTDEALFLERTHPPDWVNPLPRNPYDLIVVGGGPAGLAAAEYAARRGRTVALVEKWRLGGNSLHAGSIPSKVLVHAARHASRLALGWSQVGACIHAARERVAAHHSASQLAAAGIDVFFASAAFTAPHALSTGEHALSFRKAIIATGATPRIDAIPGLSQVGYQTSDTVFDMPGLPARLGIIGGGPLGCELAQALRRLGAHVILVQNDPKFLPEVERDAAELLSRALVRDGVETRLNTTVIGVRSDAGSKWLDTVNDEVRASYPVDELVLTIGRTPNVDALGLSAADIAVQDHGVIVVDEFLCTSNPDVLVAGDVCPVNRFANVAAATGRLAAINALGGAPQAQRDLLVPACTYCDPEIAHIGLSAVQARALGLVVTTYTVMMQDVDRAITDGQEQGFVKLHVRLGSDEILGATIVAARASEMINEMAVILHAKMGMRQLARIMHSYPAQSDAIRQAAVAYVQAQDTALEERFEQLQQPP